MNIDEFVDLARRRRNIREFKTDEGIVFTDDKTTVDKLMFDTLKT